MVLRTIDQADLQDKIVIIRTDYNVPMDGLKITDNTRIAESVPTIREILDRGARKVIIVSHLGRPVGSVVEDLRLAPIVAELESCLGEEISYLRDDVNSISREKIESQVDKVICLENIRFDSREEKGDENLAKKLASLADIFVLDAFSVAHRPHASVVGVAKYLPAFAGRTLAKEFNDINSFLQTIRKPFFGVFGGIKLDDKMPVIRSLAGKLDCIVLGSSIAVAFLHRFGFGVGDSVVTKDSDKVVDQFWDFVNQSGIKVIFPKDLVIGSSLTNERVKVLDIDFEKIISKEIVPMSICEEKEGVYDIGEKSIEELKNIFGTAGSIFWNGPLGWAEKEKFAYGTLETAKLMSESKAVVLVGGGDTVGFIASNNLSTKFDYVSTSGGAMLEYIANNTLPGLEIVGE